MLSRVCGRGSSLWQYSTGRKVVPFDDCLRRTMRRRSNKTF